MEGSEDDSTKICSKLIYLSATEKDPTKRLQLSLELSEFLTKQNGLSTLISATIDFDASSQIKTTHNQRFIAVSNIITRSPKLCLPYDKFCGNIYNQLKPMLISDNSQHSTLACIIVNSMLESPHAKTKNVSDIILSPLLAGLGMAPGSSMIKPHEAVITLHNLLQNHLPTNLVVGMFTHLFYCLVRLLDTPSRLNSLIRPCLYKILDELDPGAACCLLEQTILYSDNIHRLYDIGEENGEITIQVRSQTDDRIVHKSREDNYEIVRRVVISGEKSLLENCNNELLVLEFFFHFQGSMWLAKDEGIRNQIAYLIEPLSPWTTGEKSSKYDLLSLIAMNTSRSLELIARIPSNYVEFLRSGGQYDSKESFRIRSHVGDCLSILEALCAENGINLVREKCLPILEELYKILSNNDQDSQLCQSLNSLNTRLKATSQEFESISGKSFDIQVAKEFSDIIKDLNDRHVPVRAHALFQLKEMIIRNDKYAVSRIPELCSMLESSLSDPEPYIYLACINLFAEMSVRRTDILLPKLLELYSRKDLDLQLRMKAGEILVRLVKQMNETTPLYADQMMGTLFNIYRDEEEELMRISSLTNMGEICKNLSNSLSKYMIEILCLIEAAAENSTLDIKCAALDLLRTTLMGLDRSGIDRIQGEFYSIYSLLKKLKLRTLDDTSLLWLQLDLALIEMKRLHDELLDDNTGTLVKEIKIMSV